MFHSSCRLTNLEKKKKNRVRGFAKHLCFFFFFFFCVFFLSTEDNQVEMHYSIVLVISRIRIKKKKKKKKGFAKHLFFFFFFFFIIRGWEGRRVCVYTETIS